MSSRQTGLGDDPVTAEAISLYHDSLSDSIASESAELMENRLKSDNLYFGERPLCSVLRPRFLTPAQYRYVSRASTLVVSAMEKVRKAAMTDHALRTQFRLLDWEERLIHADPGFASPSPVSRLDAFFAPGENGLKYTEYNAECPAGAAYNDSLTKLFLDLPAMQGLKKSYSVYPLPAAPGTVHALLDAFYSWKGRREKPSVVILDWKEVPTWSEFVLFEGVIKRMGIPVILGDPRDAEYSNGVLTIGGHRVNLIYKRVLIDELIERCGENGPIVRAVQDGAVCMVNPFRCKLLHKKASLSVVSDERQSHLFTREEYSAVLKHVPWTRLVEERRTEYNHETIDLIKFVLDHKDSLVLKPNDDYGGKGIVLGWTVTDSEWSDAVKVALSTPYIVQERVVLPVEEFPAWTGAGIHIGERMVDTAPFLMQQNVVEGCLSRISTDPLLNVTSGGGSNIPTLLIEER